MHTMQLKEIGMAQAEEIKAIIEDAFSAEPWQDDWHDRQQFDLYVSDLVNQPNSLALGLYEDNQLIAIALGRIIHWYEGTQYRIDDLGVRTEKQGAGIGSLLLQEIEAYAATHALCSITLKTNRQAAAYGFYLKNGFVEAPDDVCFEKPVVLTEHTH